MKHEYTGDELAELKSIYAESGEAGLQIGEMRALRKAGLLTQDLPPKPHEDTLADYQAISVPKPKPKPEEPRTIIANALVGIFDAVSALQRTAFQANDKVVYQFATKLLTGELMDIKANYSKDAAK